MCLSCALETMMATERDVGLIQDSVSLSDQGIGSIGLVSGVSGDSHLVSRLRELGVMPGVRIRVRRSCCPMVVQVGETRLGLRKKDAKAIRVRPAEGQSWT